MKYPPAPLTPFLASPSQNLRVPLSHRSPLPIDRSGCSSSVFRSPLFSTTYELPPPTHRFPSPAFSCTYELLFSQLPCFHRHLRCPLVFRFFSPLATRLRRTSEMGHPPLATRHSPLPVLSVVPSDERHTTNPQSPPQPLRRAR